MEIKGTRKVVLDDVNKQVKLLGFDSLTLVGFLAGLFVGSMICFFVNLLAVVFYVTIYAIVILAISKKFKESQKNGVENPIKDFIDSKSSYSNIIMKTTFIEELYEQREG